MTPFGEICTNGIDAAPVGQICCYASDVSLNYSFDLGGLIEGILKLH